jgi:hypothetical protein
MDEQRITPRLPDGAEPRREVSPDEDYLPRGRLRGPDYEKERNYLNLLSIFWFILLGIQCLALAILPMEAAFFTSMFTSGAMGSGPNAPPPELGYIFMGILGFAFLLAAAEAIFTGLTAFSLRKRKRYMLCLVYSFVICVLHVPLGTVLGVFTIIVLQRPLVKDLFRYGAEALDRGARPEDEPYGS